MFTGHPSAPMVRMRASGGRDEQPSPCCAKCRRGTRGFGTLPCGYDRNCPNRCHERSGS